jgi:hypothetical protein
MNLPQRTAAALLGCAVLLVPAACSGGDDFCDVATDAKTDISKVGDQTMEEAAASWTGAGEQMESVDAPEEIADSWDTMTATVVQVGEYFTSGTHQQKVSDATEALLADEFMAARTAVYDYADKTCEV